MTNRNRFSFLLLLPPPLLPPCSDPLPFPWFPFFVDPPLFSILLRSHSFNVLLAPNTPQLWSHRDECDPGRSLAGSQEWGAVPCEGCVAPTSAGLTHHSRPSTGAAHRTRRRAGRAAGSRVCTVPSLCTFSVGWSQKRGLPATRGGLRPGKPRAGVRHTRLCPSCSQTLSDPRQGPHRPATPPACWTAGLRSLPALWPCAHPVRRAVLFAGLPPGPARTQRGPLGRG